jgi:hypothetical protein
MGSGASLVEDGLSNVNDDHGVEWVVDGTTLTGINMHTWVESIGGTRGGSP